MSILSMVGKAANKGPGAVGRKVTKLSPGRYLNSAAMSISRLLNKIPGVRTILGGGSAGVVVIGLVSLFIVYKIITTMVM